MTHEIDKLTVDFDGKFAFMGGLDSLTELYDQLSQCLERFSDEELGELQQRIESGLDQLGRLQRSVKVIKSLKVLWHNTNGVG